MLSPSISLFFYRPESRAGRAGRQYSGWKRTVIDGPFIESKELIAGYTIIHVKSKEEAIEWAKRFLVPHDEKEPDILYLRSRS